VGHSAYCIPERLCSFPSTCHHTAADVPIRVDAGTDPHTTASFDSVVDRLKVATLLRMYCARRFTAGGIVVQTHDPEMGEGQDPSPSKRNETSGTSDLEG
jgi:hypothetical protein